MRHLLAAILLCTGLLTLSWAQDASAPAPESASETVQAPVSAAPQSDAAADTATENATTSSVTAFQPRLLSQILQQAITASDELNIIAMRMKQSQDAVGEARSAYYPQVNISERFGRDAAYPSANRSKTDPRGQSEFVNANATKLEVNQMVFDGFKTSSEVARQQSLLAALGQRYNATRQDVMTETLDSYLTAWRHLQALRAGVAMVEDMRTLKAKIDLQAEAGAADQTVKSYVDSRLTGATQELLKTRNAYREALFRLGFLMQEKVEPETFSFPTLMAPVLQDVDAYISAARTQNPEVLEELANRTAAEYELRKARAGDYPTLSLTSDIQDSNDIGGSVGTQRTGNAMVQLSYKLFDGFASRHGKARVKNQIAESQYRLRRTSRRLEEDLSQSWRKVVASQQEAKLAADEAAASLKVKRLRTQDVESGTGDIVRLVEAEEALYASVLRQLDLVQTVTSKRYGITIDSGLLGDLSCVDGGCKSLPMEAVTFTNPAELPPLATTQSASATEVVSATEVQLPVSTTTPQEPIADTGLTPPPPETAPEQPPVAPLQQSPTSGQVPVVQPQAPNPPPADNQPAPQPPAPVAAYPKESTAKPEDETPRDYEAPPSTPAAP